MGHTHSTVRQLHVCPYIHSCIDLFSTLSQHVRGYVSQNEKQWPIAPKYKQRCIALLYSVVWHLGIDWVIIPTFHWHYSVSVLITHAVFCIRYKYISHQSISFLFNAMNLTVFTKENFSAILDSPLCCHMLTKNRRFLISIIEQWSPIIR